METRRMQENVALASCYAAYAAAHGARRRAAATANSQQKRLSGLSGLSGHIEPLVCAYFYLDCAQEIVVHTVERHTRRIEERKLGQVKDKNTNTNT